ncbi:MAG: hypothetical protein PVF58_22560 [Candidatus Methanofastidiosia archaeon]|jgi:hypothetical protein
MKKIVVLLVLCGLLLAGTLSIIPDAGTHEIKDFDFTGNEDLTVSGEIHTNGGGGTGGGPAPG